MVGRRAFILGAGAAGLSAAAGRRPAVLPPGALSLAHLRANCLACGLCRAACPNKVLVPAGPGDYGPLGMLMPRLDFSAGACDPDCAACASACPARVLARMHPRERARTVLGVAEWTPDACRACRGTDECSICLERCPVRALSRNGETQRISVDERLCVGCGRCEQYCPSHAFAVRAFACQSFAFGDDTLAAYLRNGDEWTSQARGVKPLVDAIALGDGRFAGARCYDRIVGRAAAFLYAKLAVASVFAPVMSTGAIRLLRRHGIACRCITETESIRNRRDDGPCPMDTAVKDVGDDRVDEAVKILSARAG